MDANHINPFIETLLYILDTTAQLKGNIKKPYLKKDPSSNGPVSGLIEMSGDIKGFVSITFSEEAILKIVSVMFGEDMTELNDDVKDAVGELVNMVCGQATNKFAENGNSIKVESHGIKDGEKHFLPNIEERPFLTIPVETEAGNLYIDVSLEK
ncbi:MAG: chemotaxis protein CheX [Thermodesulfobacteriota bacterium]